MMTQYAKIKLGALLAPARLDTLVMVLLAQILMSVKTILTIATKMQIVQIPSVHFRALVMLATPVMEPIARILMNAAWDRIPVFS